MIQENYLLKNLSLITLIIKTGCLTSDEAAKSFILRNKKNPYIMKYRDFFTKEVIKAYEFYNID